MAVIKKGATGRKWYENYLPFVAKSPAMQLEWLLERLSRLRSAEDPEKRGLLSRRELTPYISLLLDGNASGKKAKTTSVAGDALRDLLDRVRPGDLLLMVECAEIYDIPRLFGLLRTISREQAVLAMKKTPPPYEKNPLLVVDRVFHAVKEKSPEILASAAEEIMNGGDPPRDFAANYERFREIMMDEHILGMLYPKAN
ncbi:MAG: hypothetical protein P1P81_03905 [Desulfobulbales bacterium]|nr:hypothetical protein [Desulfobulbales bacterium]